MKSLIRIVAGLLLIPSGAFAQFKLQLYDQLTTQPLAFAEVSYEWTDPGSEKKNIRLAVTDKAGECELEETAIKNQAVFTITHSSVGIHHLTAYQLIDRNYKLYLNRKTQQLDESIVSANRTNEKARDVARQVEVINRRQIIFANAQNTADLLFSQGNLFIQKSQQGGGSPVIRGFESNRVLLVVDGVRLNNAIFRAGHLQNALRIDQNVLTKAEVLYGAGSVIYGSDAMGGVVNLITRNPELNITGKPVYIKNELYSRYSSANNEVTYHYNINIGLKKWASFSAFTHSDFGNVTQGKNRDAKWERLGLRPYFVKRLNGADAMISNPDIHEQVESNYRQSDLIQKLMFSPNTRNQHILNFQYSNTSNVPRYDRLTDTTASGTLRSAQWYYGPEKRILLAYSWDHSMPRRLFDKIRITPAWQRIGESRHDRNFNSNQLRSRMEEVDVYSLNIDLFKKVRKHELRYGFDVQHNDVRSVAYQTNIVTAMRSPFSTRYPAGGSTLTSGAVFISHNWELNDHFILNDGVRFSFIRTTASFGQSRDFFSFLPAGTEQQNIAVNDNLGVVYLLNKTTRMYANAATGFRAPNIDDLGKLFDSSPDNVILPNPNLKPEQCVTIESGINTTIRKMIQMNASVFYTQLYDAIVVGPTQVNGNDSINYGGTNAKANTLKNAQEAYLYGYQLTAHVFATKNITVYGAYTFTYGRVVNGTTETPLDHIPPVYGKGGVNLQLKGIMFDAYTQFSGPKAIKDYSSGGEDNLQYATSTGMPSWFTLNVKGQYSRYYRGVLLTLQSGIENIADIHYRHFASGISAPGRNVFVTVRVGF